MRFVSEIDPRYCIDEGGTSDRNMLKCFLYHIQLFGPNTCYLADGDIEIDPCDYITEESLHKACASYELNKKGGANRLYDVLVEMGMHKAVLNEYYPRSFIRKVVLNDPDLCELIFMWGTSDTVLADKFYAKVKETEEYTKYRKERDELQA